MASLVAKLASILKRGSAAAPAAPAADLSLSDLTPEERAILKGAQPFTLTSPERLAALMEGVKYVVQHKIPGDIAECGVWRGGSMVAIARTLLFLGDTRRELYLYDTFEGMSAPTEHDRDFSGAPAAQMLQEQSRDSSVWAVASLDEVKANLRATGYPQEKIHFVRGKVEDTIPATIPTQLSLLRLDTDWYESTKHELAHLYPRLSQRGLLVIDDYGHWQGARKAVDEFNATLPRPLYFHRVDYTGRMAVKI